MVLYRGGINMTKEQIVEKIQRLRMEKGYSMCKLAKLSGISQTGYNHIEQRKTDMNVQTLQKICDALEISMRDFFDESVEHIPDRQKVYLVSWMSQNERIFADYVNETKLKPLLKLMRETGDIVVAISKIDQEIMGILVKKHG